MSYRIRLVTDSNSGITEQMAEELGISIIPMPFYINGDTYYEGITLNQDDFYKHLESGADVSTSQPAIGEVMKLWDELLKVNDYVIYIPMSSALSGTYETAAMMAQDYDGKVVVINNRRISVTQLQSVLDAVDLINQGKSAEEIKKVLEDRQYNASIYLVPDTLDYLKKGGRVTPAVASFAKVLNIKPVLEIQGEKLDSFKKVRGIKQAKRVMKEAIMEDLKNRFKNIENVKIYTAYTKDKEFGEQWRQEIQEEFPEYTVELYPLSLSVSCHIGPGSIGVACVEEIK